MPDATINEENGSHQRHDATRDASPDRSRKARLAGMRFQEIIPEPDAFKKAKRYKGQNKGHEETHHPDHNVMEGKTSAHNRNQHKNVCQQVKVWPNFHKREGHLTYRRISVKDYSTPRRDGEPVRICWQTRRAEDCPPYQLCS
jgi:hypothetical protein